MDENGISPSVDTGGSSDSGHSSVDAAPSAPSAPPSEAVSGPSDSSAGPDTSGAGDGAPAASDGDSVAVSEGTDTSGTSDSDLVGAIGDLVDALQGGVTDTGDASGDAVIVDGEGNELPVRDAEWFAELYGEYVGIQEDTGLQLESIETYALSPIESSTGLKGILLDIIGPYDNVVTQYKYQSNTSSNYTYVNEITPDYPWIASAALFVALVISVFSLLRKALWTL